MKKAKNPWKTVSSKELYNNPWIKVVENNVISPTGAPGIYGNVHFKHKAIGIIPLDEDLNTWIVGQYRYVLEEYSWEIPMGGGAKEESNLSAAKRELKEETGIEAKEWEQILKVHLSNSITDEVGYVFVAKKLTFGATDFDATEDLKIRKLPFLELFKMVQEGQITDVITIAGVMKLAYLLKI